MKPRYAVAIAVCFLAIYFAVGQSATPTNANTSRVDAILNKMTLKEKIDYIGGTGFATRSLPNLGVPAFGMSDGPLGVRSNLRFTSSQNSLKRSYKVFSMRNFKSPERDKHRRL